MEQVREYGALPDAALVEDHRNGHPEAFGVLMRRYKDRIYNVAYRYLGSHEDAQDLTQEVFVRAYGSLNSFEGRSQLPTWLHAIAANLAKNRLRDRSRKGRNRAVSLEAGPGLNPGRGASWAQTDVTPETEARLHETQGALQEALDGLPEHYRLVFVLRTFERLSYEEIAEVAGCPKGTVKSRLNQARKELHRALTEKGVI